VGLGGLAVRQVSYYNSLVEVHPAARRHGIADEDIEHAVTNAMVIEAQDEETTLYLGPARNADLLEIVTVARKAKLSLRSTQ
jgi:GNAT superfamily N-acetyltransferase